MPTSNEPFYYEVLSIPVDATAHEIRSAYLRKAIDTHPDKHPPETREQAEADFKLLHRIYETLKDEKQRREYDASHKARLNSEFYAKYANDKEALYKRSVEQIISALQFNTEATNYIYLLNDLSRDQSIKLVGFGLDPEPDSDSDGRMKKLEELLADTNYASVKFHVTRNIIQFQYLIAQNASARIQPIIQMKVLRKLIENPALLESLFVKGARSESPVERLIQYSRVLVHNQPITELLSGIVNNKSIIKALFKNKEDIHNLHARAGINSVLHHNIDLRVAMAKIGVHVYKLLPRTGKGSPLSWFSQWFDSDRGIIRANVYDNLLAQAQSPLEKKILTYAILDNRTGGSTFKKYVAEAMGFNYVYDAKQVLTASLKADLPRQAGDKQDNMKTLNALLYPIINNANYKRPATDASYAESISKIRQFIADKQPQKSVVLRNNNP